MSFINALGKAAHNKQTKPSTLYAKANKAKVASAPFEKSSAKKGKSKIDRLTFKQMYFLSRP
jgi:hypothetical protein